jgi:WD40 repeat protein
MNGLITSVIRVLNTTDQTLGTGFIITDDGFIATCAHVVTAGKGPVDSVHIAFHATGETTVAHVETLRETEDVAILRLNTPLPEDVCPLQLGASHDTKHRTFDTFGFPAAKPVEGMAGKCEVIGETTQQGFRVLQIRAGEVTRGYSGAPVWDADLQTVIGMVTSVAPQDELGKQGETAFIIPVETLREVCPGLQLPTECPYRGLEVFEREHADLYFGRETATQELLTMLSQRDFVALVGVSGSGKSSLVRAGLEKSLHQHAIPGLAKRHRCLVVPGRSPMFNLALALANLPTLSSETVARALDIPVEALIAEGEARRQGAEILDGRSPASLAGGLQSLTSSEGLLLIADQFERLYTECPDQEVRDRFIDTLLQAAGDKIKVLLVLRADFYGLALLHPALEGVVKQDGQVTLGRMNEVELRSIIEEPARQLGRSLQPGLAERLITAVQGQAGDLPLLEFALTELWEQDSQKGVLTLATYDSLGYQSPDGRRFSGVQGAIAQRAEEVWQALNESERRAARRVFLNLVTPGLLDERGERLAEDSSRRAWQAEWDETTRRAVRQLVDARLLTTGQDPVSDQPTVEVAHEALIRSWPRLQRWLADYRPFMRWYNTELAPFLHRWLDKDYHHDLLLPQAMLAPAEHWLRQYPEELSGPPEAYIQASLEKHERERVVQERRRRRITMAAVGAAIGFLILALLTWGQRNAARDAQATAVAEADARATAQAQAEGQARLARIRALAAQAESELEQRPQRSLLLALEAFDLAQQASRNDRHIPAAEQALRDALGTVGGIGLSGHEWEIGVLAFSPDGRWLATGSSSGPSLIGYFGSTRLWDLTASNPSAEPIVLSSDGNGVQAMAFSPNGRWLATGGGDPVRLWDLTASDSAEPLDLLDHEKGALQVAFSPDGYWLAAAGSDDTVRLWDLTASDSYTEPLILHGHEDVVFDVVFSPSSRWLATGSLDNTVRLWDLTTSDLAEPLVLRGHENGVSQIAFSPDGHWLAAASLDNAVRLWDMTASDSYIEPLILRGHEDEIYDVVFSPSSRWLATGSLDNTVRLWDMTASDRTEPLVLYGHQGEVYDVAFSRDGRWLATGSSDKTTRLWDLTASDPAADSLVLHGHEMGVTALAFDPNGHWLATASEDTTARLWNLTALSSAADPTILQGYRPLAFSSDGRWLANTVDANAVHLRNLNMIDHAAKPLILRGHEDVVYKVLFSPDSRWLATGSVDDVAYLWNLAAPEPAIEPLLLHDYDHQVSDMYFSPDARWILTQGWETARLWDLTVADTGADPLVWHSRENRMWEVAFSPDGHWLVTASPDDTARLWDLTASDPYASSLVLCNDRNRITAISFTPDNRRLATVSGDATIRLWDLTVTHSVTGTFTLRHEDESHDLTFSPGGRWLAAKASNGLIQLWDLTASDLTADPLVLQGREDENYVAFSPNDRWLTTRWEDAVWLWDLMMTDPISEPLLLHDQDDRVRETLFSPDGHWLAAIGSDTSWVWNLTTHAPSEPLVLRRGQEWGVDSVAFSPDEQWLATGGCDETRLSGLVNYCVAGSIRLWDLTVASTVLEPVVLRGYRHKVSFLAFSPDGRWLVGDSLGLARLWRMQPDELVGLACRTAGRNLTLEEWQLYFPDQEYDTTCPNLPIPEVTTP